MVLRFGTPTQLRVHFDPTYDRKRLHNQLKVEVEVTVA